MNDTYTLEQKLDYARHQLALGQQALESANKVREDARELGGGLLSFGGSGSQRARRQVQAATERGLRRSSDAAARIAEWERKIHLLEQMIAERDRVRLTREDLIGATHVRLATGWWKVARLNKTTVSVATGYSWTDRHAFDKVLEVRTVA